MIGRLFKAILTLPGNIWIAYRWGELQKQQREKEGK